MVLTTYIKKCGEYVGHQKSKNPAITKETCPYRLKNLYMNKKAQSNSRTFGAPGADRDFPRHAFES